MARASAIAAGVPAWAPMLIVLHSCACTAYAGSDDTLSIGGTASTSGVGATGARRLPMRGRVVGAGGAGGVGADELEDASAPLSAGGALETVRDAAVAEDAGGLGRDAAPDLPSCIGSALRLDGSNFAAIARPVQDDFTLEAWIRTTSSLDGDNHFEGRGVLDADVVGQIADDFSTEILNDRFAMGTGNPDVTVQGTAVVTTGDWVHVAATRRAADGQLQIVVNGALEATAVLGRTGSLDAAMILTFGGSSIVRNFIGEIDEVRIWNVVRTPAELAANMREVSSGDEPGLVGYYRFESVDAGVAADSSSAHAPAALLGNPSFEPSTALCPAP